MIIYLLTVEQVLVMSEYALHMPDIVLPLPVTFNQLMEHIKLLNVIVIGNITIMNQNQLYQFV